MKFNCLAIIVFFASPCDATLRGMKDPTSSKKTHRKLEPSGHNPQETNEYIVILNKQEHNLESFEARVRAVGGTVQFVYRNIFLGAAIEIADKSDLFHILDDDTILAATSRFPPWGLDRLDEASWPLNNRYQYEFDGSGVHVYILDTGIRVQHKEFDGRARCAFNAVKKESCADHSSHGTHVAALIGGKNFGVAKNVTLQIVKVLDKDGNGTFADLLAGIEYVVEMKLRKTPKRPMVMNLSLNGGKSTIVNNAIQVAIDAGITVVAAAGNDRDDACNYSPGSARDVITVGATGFDGFATQMDRRADFSNTGNCVDIFAPGVGITSASDVSNLAIRTMSGTSMASPFVAGAAALYLQRDPTKSHLEVWHNMQKDARKGRIELFSATETPNVLLSTKEIVSRKQ